MHEGGFHGIAIVVAHEMQHAVRHEEGQLQDAGHPQPAGVPRRGLARR